MPLEQVAAGAPQSFLRSPPFGWLRSGAGAVILADDGDGASVQEAEAVLDDLRQARVGGAFWAAPGADGDCWTYVAQQDRICVVDHVEPLAFIAYLSGKPVEDGTGARIDPAVLHRGLIAALMRPAYRDPFTGERATLAATVALLGDWRRSLDANRDIVATAGMATWKRAAIGQFLWSERGSPPDLAERIAVARAARTGGAVAYWPSRVAPGFVAHARGAGAVPVAVEDGFIRSEGLGADCRVPYSIAVDRGGPHYDPGAASDLEAILAEHPFPQSLVERAAALRRRIREANVTKYGIGDATAADLPIGKRVVLAIGQVDDDLSVRSAGAGIAGNAAFLERVRAAEPDAHIIYRPHPDVLAGHRTGHVAGAVAARLVDEVRQGGALLPLIEAVDAVHVLSSLTGFETLLRERPVVVHGQPFYAGWGLTQDLAPPLPRRGRKLTIDQLVAGALILYPRYLDPVTGLPCGPEILIERMAVGAATGDSLLTYARKAQGAVRRGATLLREAFS